MEICIITPCCDDLCVSIAEPLRQGGGRRRQTRVPRCLTARVHQATRPAHDARPFPRQPTVVTGITGQALGRRLLAEERSSPLYFLLVR